MDSASVMKLFRSNKSTIDIANQLVCASQFSSGWKRLLEMLDETVLDYTQGTVYDLKNLHSSTPREMLSALSSTIEYVPATIFDVLKETALDFRFGLDFPVIVLDTKIKDAYGNPLVMVIEPDGSGRRKINFIPASSGMKFSTYYHIAIVEIDETIGKEEIEAVLEDSTRIC